MQYEPDIDRARLIAAVREAYGLAAEQLRFMPVGFAAACYVVDDATGRQHFLKLWPNARGRSDTARRERSLRLTRALYERQLYPRVPYPLVTRDGALWASYAGAPFAIFQLLAGDTPPPIWSPALQEEFGRTLAALHRATPALADVLPARETFAIRCEAGLRRGLAAVARIAPGARPGLRALREFVLPRKAEILAQLARLHGLQRVVRRLDSPFVLCHTDIGGDNLLVDDQGRLSVLDWDDASVAPPEYDLHEARWVGPARVLEVYTAAGGAAPLHLEHFAFALLRRHLEDMSARLERMLAPDAVAEADADLLDGIAAWGFAQWEALDTTLAPFATALG